MRASVKPTINCGTRRLVGNGLATARMKVGGGTDGERVQHGVETGGVAQQRLRLVVDVQAVHLRRPKVVEAGAGR